MFEKSEILSLLAEALEVQTVSDDDSSSTIETWDSLGQLSIQAKLSAITNGKSDQAPELAVAGSVEEIVVALRSLGLIQ